LQLQPKTLLWSLDGALRYLPVAALHDGKQFLVEKYSSAVVTLAQPAPDFSIEPQKWRALGGGVSDAFENLPALTYVKGELDNLVDNQAVNNLPAKKGAFAGKVLFNREFSRSNLKNTLNQQFQLIHFATHFVLKPGNVSDSFLLLGNREKLYLNELRSFDFKGVDLLTLSACETDATYVDANGVEIESLGVIAQKRGAKTVIASLWKIYDKSTPELMKEFYTRYQSGKGLVSKAEALRQAQLAIINKNYKHPVFWAPFIVLGEWR
jgi:CHAT domain-containing protein